MKKVFILSWPSWVGKTTIYEEYMKNNGVEKIQKIITTTTRSKRDYETHWKDYYFVSIKEFQKLIDNGKLIEYAKVHWNFYGSTYDELEKIISNWKIPLYIVDPQWVKYLSKVLWEKYDVKTIFILPPSKEELKKRLIKRWETQNSKSFQTRVNESLKWLEEKDDYDYHIVNDDLKKAVEEFSKIVW